MVNRRCIRPPTLEVEALDNPLVAVAEADIPLAAHDDGLTGVAEPDAEVWKTSVLELL